MLKKIINIALLVCGVENQIICLTFVIIKTENEPKEETTSSRIEARNRADQIVICPIKITTKNQRSSQKNCSSEA